MLKIGIYKNKASVLNWNWGVKFVEQGGGGGVGGWVEGWVWRRNFSESAGYVSENNFFIFARKFFL